MAAVCRAVMFFNVVEQNFFHKHGIVLQKCHLAAGEMVMRYGDEGDSVHLIYSGRVKVVDQHGNGITRLAAGSFVGEGGYLSGSRLRNATVEADQPSVVYVVEREVLELMIAEYPVLEDELLSVHKARRLHLKLGITQPLESKDNLESLFVLAGILLDFILLSI